MVDDSLDLCNWRRMLSTRLDLLWYTAPPRSSTLLAGFTGKCCSRARRPAAGFSWKTASSSCLSEPPHPPSRGWTYSATGNRGAARAASVSYGGCCWMLRALIVRLAAATEGEFEHAARSAAGAARRGQKGTILPVTAMGAVASCVSSTDLRLTWHWPLWRACGRCLHLLALFTRSELQDALLLLYIGP